MKKIIALLLAVCMLTACAPKAEEIVGENLMKSIQPNNVVITEEGAPTAAVTDFTVRLLQNSS